MQKKETSLCPKTNRSRPKTWSCIAKVLSEAKFARAHFDSGRESNEEVTVIRCVGCHGRARVEANFGKPRDHHLTAPSCFTTHRIARGLGAWLAYASRQHGLHAIGQRCQGRVHEVTRR